MIINICQDVACHHINEIVLDFLLFLPNRAETVSFRQFLVINDVALVSHAPPSPHCFHLGRAQHSAHPLSPFFAIVHAGTFLRRHGPVRARETFLAGNSSNVL